MRWWCVRKFAICLVSLRKDCNNFCKKIRKVVTHFRECEQCMSNMLSPPVSYVHSSCYLLTSWATTTWHTQSWLWQCCLCRPNSFPDYPEQVWIKFCGLADLQNTKYWACIHFSVEGTVIGACAEGFECKFSMLMHNCLAGSSSSYLCLDVIYI